VLLDPAAVSGSHRLLRLPTIAFQNIDTVGLRMTTLRGSITSLLVTAHPSLCLRLAHVVTSISPRLDSKWGGSFPLPGRELHPLEAPGLAWRTKVRPQVKIDDVCLVSDDGVGHQLDRRVRGPLRSIC
jgi:hypothetical protein